MKYNWAFSERDLKFKFDAGTSRGVLKSKYSAFIKLFDPSTNKIGIGEAGPLKGLSQEFDMDLKLLIDSKLKELGGDEKLIQEFIEKDFETYSSVKFAIESAYLDINGENPFQLFQTDFFRGEQQIPINGLVWMGDYKFMRDQIDQKIKLGFDCIKIKIGAIDVDREMALVHELRKGYSKDKMVIRVDANGAFQYDEAKELMNELYKLGIHSIEQPIAVKNFEDISRLAKDNPLAVALDEELIDIREPLEKQLLLKTVKPQYIVLKPSLHGGFYETSQWIEFAKSENIGWWVTSALESNIGLNAIAQFTSQYKTSMHQGLGTGQLYENNITSPLTIESGKISYNKNSVWDLEDLKFMPL